MDGGDVFFESEEAKTLYDKMFDEYRASVKRNETWDGRIESLMSTPSPYDKAEKEGYKWSLERAETPEFIVKIAKKAISKNNESSTHLATFYKK